MDINLDLTDEISLNMYDFRGVICLEFDSDDRFGEDYYYLSIDLDKAKELHKSLGELIKTQEKQ